MSGRGEDNDVPKGPPGGGGPTVNGSIEGTLTPELLFRMNKKIAQLTKVVYGLNTRGEELEAQVTTTKESEEALKTSNTELQHRLNHCKSKVETELGRLRELETEAGQAHYWKHECESLRRRLELESGLMGGGDVRAVVGAAREDAERAHRREKAMAYELEQARQAITSLKSHHDFIMRERDAQEAMEREKLELEWQTRLAEIENRYKSQVRRVTDDMEVLTAECDILRRRAADCGSGESSLRDQIMAMERDHEQQRREFEMAMQMKVQEEQEEILAFGKERRDYDARIRQLHEDRRVADEQWDERLREKSREYERKLREAIDKRDAMQQRIDSKEEGFEGRLRAKVDEWKAEWDEVEEGLRGEIRKLKNECESVRADTTLVRSRQERGSIESEMKIRDLEEQLANKNNEFDNKTRNLMIRLTTVESANKQQGQEKNEAERKMREEKDRNRQVRMDYEIVERVKQDLEQRLKLLSDSERQLQERNTLLTVENEEVKGEIEELKQKTKTKEREMTTKMELVSKTSEARLKQRIEKTWLDKLRRSEANAAQDLERLRDAQRRTEGDLRKELTQLKKTEEETRRLNEEFKKKVRTLRQADTEATHKITELDDRVQELTKKLGAEGGSKELGVQEDRYQKQIDELTLSLAQKQEEVSKLSQTLETLKGVQDTLSSSEELQEKLSLLQQDVRDRSAQLDCAREELESSKDDMELTKAKLKKLEEDLDGARQKNLALQNQITATANCDKTEELETKIKSMEEQLKATTEERDKLTKTIDETETERDEEIKIIQDALDEAAQEREDLIGTFEKEIQNMTTMNTNREQQLLEDFEWKLREMEKDHKKKMEERERKAESTLQRAKRQAEETEAEFRQKQEKMKNELNAEWEDKLRSECSRLKAELDELHAEEKHLAVESMKVQKEQELRELKQTWEQRTEEMTKEISKLKDSLTEKDAYYHKEMENMRTNADRDVWELRRKLQRLDEKNWTQQEVLQEKHHEELERLRTDYEERTSDLEARLGVALKESDPEARQQAEKVHNDEMEHLCQQHRLSMERLREELEAEKYQAMEEARVIVTKHHEYLNVGLREQLTEATTSSTQSREELDTVKSTLALRDDMIKSLEEDLARQRDAEGAPAASYTDSQSSIASSSESTCSQGSNNSQDHLSISESVGASIDSQDDAHKSGGSGLLGKMFGGNWFSGSKTKEHSRRGSAPGKQSS